MKFALESLQVPDGSTDEQHVIRTNPEILGKFHQRFPAPFNGDDVGARPCTHLGSPGMPPLHAADAKPGDSDTVLNGD